MGHPVCIYIYYILGAQEPLKVIKETLIEYIGLKYNNGSEVSAIIKQRMEILQSTYESSMTNCLGIGFLFPSIDLVASKDDDQPWTDLVRKVMRSCMECLLTNYGDFNAGNIFIIVYNNSNRNNHLFTIYRHQ
jgi:4-aminobutyrate aminotransferase-like enzyme